MMSELVELEKPPAGWFVLDVLLREARNRWDWAAIMIDVDPDEFIARSYRTTRSCWVRIPGKHKDRDAA
jgi:hypothetical protein